MRVEITRKKSKTGKKEKSGFGNLCIIPCCWSFSINSLDYWEPSLYNVVICPAVPERIFKELVFFGPGEFVPVCVFSDVLGLFCLCGDGLYRRQQGAASDPGGQGQQACPAGALDL